MAIYHCSLRVFSRERGHSAVAAAAYRSGQKLIDERTGTVHRYEKRRGVVNSQILLPPQTSEHFQERLALWNAAEAAETRKNSRVAREVIIALPYELDSKQRESLARDMAAYLVEKYRVAVDLAIHTPVDEDGHDPRNHHAHLLFTTRELTPGGLGAKTRILDDKITGPQQVEVIREVWETLANDALSRAGHSDVKIDRRTLESQGIERIPQIHEGKTSTYADELTKSNREHEGDDDDTEKEGDTETGKADGEKSGSGDQGQLSPDMQSKEEVEPKKVNVFKEDETQRQPLSEEKEKSRSEFNAEIKALNEQRKEYPQTPLKLQIEEIEREIDAIDRRVERLQVMLDKTSLPQKIRRLIGDVVVKAKEFLAIRTESHTKRQLNEAEKWERHERQLARYGRSFREGIHSQIIEMKDKLETLHSREVEHKKYRAFVTMIEAEVMKIKIAPKLDISHPRQEVPAVNSKAPASVTSSNEQVSKAAAKVPEAAQVKAQVPDGYKPSPRADKLQAAFEKPQKQPFSMPVNGAGKSTQTRSSTASNLLQDTGKRDTPKLEKGKEEITAARGAKSQSYKIEANEQTKKMLGKIHSELKQIKAQEQKLAKEKPAASGKDAGLKDKFREPEPPPVKVADVIAKAKATAEKLRQSIPPEYRARPYTAEEIHPKPQAAPKSRAASSKAENTFEKFRKIWRRQASQTQPAKETTEQPKPRKTMSSTFKRAAAKPETVETSPSPEPSQRPDI